MAGWKAAHSNHAALLGRGLAIVALLSCVAWLASTTAAFVTLGFGLLGILFGGIGLKRVGPVASPAVDRRGASLFGLKGGVVSAVGAVAFLLISRLRQ